MVFFFLPFGFSQLPVLDPTQRLHPIHCYTFCQSPAPLKLHRTTWVFVRLWRADRITEFLAFSNNASDLSAEFRKLRELVPATTNVCQGSIFDLVSMILPFPPEDATEPRDTWRPDLWKPYPPIQAAPVGSNGILNHTKSIKIKPECL
ncbi:hypothetical protein HJG60_012245 [Phyllostomus discolor]|uniref:Uncharacterized protein n=1 Tax=Phyllostomus discolor TaxID=89673 RepID=A0A833ZG36_9CHIR|nr:hypothetical protein HJG60_012245 [Phyllostomus discolor]